MFDRELPHDRYGVKWPGGGRMSYVAAPFEVRGSTRHAAGLWPFGQGSGAPLIGIPMGQHQVTGTAVCADPINWFEAGLLSNPNLFVASEPGLGKALDVDTPVPTPTGTVRLGDLRPGDAVFDEAGEPTTVVAVSPAWTGRECLRVRFSDGSAVIADAEHLWVTETQRTRQRRFRRRMRPAKPSRLGTPAERQRVAALLAAARPQQTTTLRELAAELDWHADGRWHRLYRWARFIPAVGSARHGSRLFDKTLVLQQVAMALEDPPEPPPQVPEPVTTRQIAATLRSAGKTNHAIPVTGIQGEPAELPLAPRLLGLWLGDGTTDGAAFTTADPELVGRLRRAGVLGDKHIPAGYLRACTSQRRELLSGLMDTDGTVGVGGHLQYTSTNRRLAEDAYELVASLGYRPTMSTRPATLRGRVVGTTYTVGFSTPDRVFGLERKHAIHQQRRAGASRARTRLRYIVAVEPVESRPVRCIQVANPSGMYLVTRSFIATHNSTSVRRMVLGYAYQGITSLMLGDLKPDYADLVGAMGGQVIRVGPGRDRINPLDAGPWRDAIPKLGSEEARIVRDDVVARRRAMLEALGNLARGRPLSDRETTVLAAVCRLLTVRERDEQPTLRDVITAVREGPPEVREVTLDLGDDARYFQRVEALLDTLIALREGAFGSTFDGQTTTPLHLDSCAVTIDIRSIGVADEKLTAATLLVMWGHGFAQVETAHLLSDLGLAPKRRFFAVMDELWRALRAPGLVDRLDGLTRLSRAQGTGLAYISHGLDDLEALAAEHDRAKARGIAERCAMKLFGGLSPQQLQRVRSVVALSDTELEEVASWSQQDTGSVTIAAQQAVALGRAGRGRFLIKTGGEPGIPVILTPTLREQQLGDTDARFRRLGAAGSGPPVRG